MRNSVGAGLIAFAVTWIISHGRSTPYNNDVLLAQALLHGHVWINWPGAYIDALAFHGKHYIIEGPVPALLLMPFVALFGVATNQTLLTVALCGIAIGAAWEIGERIGVSLATNAWLCAFLLAGTDLLWSAMLGDVWFLAQVAAVMFSLLALAEILGKRRGWLVALLAIGAAGSRFSMVLTLPIYAYLLACDDAAPFRLAADARRRLIGFMLALAPFLALWVIYNFARWGTWNDIGYAAWYHQDQMGSPTGSPFRLAYLPMQLYAFFVQFPTVLPVAPWLRPEILGTALTWTSPALLLAFFARTPLRLVGALWLAVVVNAAPNFVYYVDGFSQFGMRHALDFEPFLFVLMLLASRERLGLWAKALIAYSCTVGLWGCWYWNMFLRPGS